ncbi:polysaccharide deacetylase family protein [Actinomadura sp. 7K534]|uniref:polysaccharide deacetylase family protein n=1 Tax=Actinomadura sp. 7K534 TaxID=2530366 RepID=UPI001A9EEBA8|nr:polysaccharide deacetylase family protein [Actinomadura sp. 7K534]
MDRLSASWSAASADTACGEPGISHLDAGREDLSGYVALTFDDGPTPATLPTLLDRLLTAGAKATFFNRGDHAEARPDLVRAQQEAQMWIGNHTETHLHLPDIAEPASFAEILRAQQILHRITGEWPSHFRPPYGETNEQVRAAEARLNLLEVLWTVDSRDWAGATPAQIVAAARTLRPGGIFLMHDWAQASIDALPQIISELRDRGLHPGKIAFTPRQVAFGDTPFHAIAVAP